MFGAARSAFTPLVVIGRPWLISLRTTMPMSGRLSPPRRKVPYWRCARQCGICGKTSDNPPVGCVLGGRKLPPCDPAHMQAVKRLLPLHGGRPFHYLGGMQVDARSFS
jgi:hypothetical protein